MLTITLLNKKGGVSKTSSCHHLSGALAKRGLRVLLVDNDPQSSLTQGFFGPDITRSIVAEESVAALYEGDPPAERIIRPTPFPRIDLVPGSDAGTHWNMRARNDWGDAIYGLRSFLRDVRADYDICLVDCPPNLHLCSYAALVAADTMIVPLQAEEFGNQGIWAILSVLAEVQSSDNPSLRLLGYLITLFDKRLAIHGAYAEQLTTLYPGQVFDTMVPRTKDFIEAVAARQPVGVYKPRSAAAKTMDTLAEEILQRATRYGLIHPERSVA